MISVYPGGDKGGNDFFVAPATRGIKLHTLWDGLPGTRNQTGAAAITQPSLRRHILGRSCRSCGEPGRANGAWKAGPSLSSGYIFGARLKGSVNADDAPALPDGYAKAAKNVAERQAALAAYRLADEIAKLVR